MDKSNALQNANELRGKIVERSSHRSGTDGLSRTSTQGEKAEISAPIKEKPPELNNQQSLPRTSYEKLLKFSPVYGTLPSHYLEQLPGM